MKRLLILIFLFALNKVNAQQDYETQIQKLAGDIAAFFKNSNQKIRLGFAPFVYNGEDQNLSLSVYEDLTSELVMSKDISTHFTLVEEAKWKTIAEISNAATDMEKLSLIGKNDIADYLCYGRISEVDNGYKILVRLYNAKEANFVMAFKATVIKPGAHNNITVTETNLNSNKSQDNGQQKETKPPKEKKSGKFWHTLGDIATQSVQQVVTTTIDQQASKIGSKQNSGDNPKTNNPNNDVVTNNSRGAAGNAFGGNNKGNTDVNDSGNGNQDNSNMQSSGNPCRSYINFVNKTDNAIEVAIYKENPNDNSYTAKVIYALTIPAGKSKKQKIEKDLLYYYTASNHVGVFSGAPKYWNGTFEVEDCTSEDEEIE